VTSLIICLSIVGTIVDLFAKEPVHQPLLDNNEDKRGGPSVRERLINSTNSDNNQTRDDPPAAANQNQDQGLTIRSIGIPLNGKHINLLIRNVLKMSQKIL
jgi:hypothetical protein